MGSLDARTLELSVLEIEQDITERVMETRESEKQDVPGKSTPTRLTCIATSQEISSRSMALSDANALEFQSRPQFQTLLIHPPHFTTMVPTMPPKPPLFPSDPELARKWLTRLSLSSKILSEIKV